MVWYQASECPHLCARPRAGKLHERYRGGLQSGRARGHGQSGDVTRIDLARGSIAQVTTGQADRNYLPARMASRRFLIAASNSSNDLLKDSTPSCCRVSPTSLKSI